MPTNDRTTEPGSAAWSSSPRPGWLGVAGGAGVAIGVLLLDARGLLGDGAGIGYAVAMLWFFRGRVGSVVWFAAAVATVLALLPVVGASSVDTLPHLVGRFLGVAALWGAAWFAVMLAPLRGEAADAAQQVHEGGVQAQDPEVERNGLRSEIAEPRRPEQLVQLAFDAASSGMMLVDADRRIVMVNTEIESIFGYRRDQLVGEQLERLIPPRFRTGHPELFAGFVSAPTARRMGEGRDLAGLTSAGVEVPVELGLMPVPTDKGLYVLATVVDITERKRMEISLRGKTEAMQELLYAVSHDLKSPLVTVNGFTAILMRHLAAGDVEKAHAAAERVQRGALTLGRLLDDLTDLNREGTRPLEIEEVRLGELLGGVVELLAADLVAAGARVEVDPDLPVVHADRRQLERVMLNLLGNAIKYGCAAPGAVIRVGATQEAGEVRLAVRDHGPGIDPKDHRRVFQIFQRLTSEVPGSGLGLATVAKILDRHGGRAWVDSRLGQGATFWVAFPESRRVDRIPAMKLDKQGGS